ncbi:osteoclast stimulatory transmembrane protein [Paramormyrops kingsleyae]|uniref:osteoclast stimulatory transmembrane protein n=1 Tax=Paramormyrops kingsleyae TaxID=1676925 RepID=UPI003B97A44E
MSSIKEPACWKFRSGLWHRANATLGWLWSIYSKTHPDGIKEVVTLMFLCLAVAFLSGIILFSWMASSLSYGQRVSGATASIYGVAAFVSLFLCHPVRCVFTMALPTLGTKQGRRFILSAAVTLLMLNVLPNIGANVGVVSHTLKCSGGNLAQSLINSSEIINWAKGELVTAAMKAKETELQFVRSLRNFDHFTYINLSNINQRFVSVSQNIERDFSHAKYTIKNMKLVASRFIAALFIIYLFVESALYLKSYLTDVKFDNPYITGHKKRNSHSAICRISRQELLRCAPRILVMSWYFTVTLLVIILDHILYHLVSASKARLLDIPPISINISLAYKVESYSPSLCIFDPSCGTGVLVDFQRVYPWSIRTGSEHCTSDLSAPDPGVAALLGLLYLLAYSMVFLEVFATRWRYTISASFFKSQEAIRLKHLHQRIRAKQGNSSIFSIETHASGGYSGHHPSFPLTAHPEPQ